MRRQSRFPFLGLFLVVIGMFILIVPAQAEFDYAYCSSQNTNSGSPTYSQWQSNGFCTEKCEGSVFAVILQNDCWCSNYAPGADQQSTDNCNDACPGYPTERCGNKDKKLYMYIRIAGAQASGTQGGSAPTSSARTKSSSPDPTTLQTSAAPANPQTSVRTISMSNSVVTETIVTTPSSTPIDTSTEKSSSNTGAIVGGVVGGVVGLAALTGGIFFALWRRRRQHRTEQDDDGQSGMQRNVSTMSKSGLLRTEKPAAYPPAIATNFPRRQSRNLDQESISPISGSDRRNSRPMVDQRLNPSAIFVLDNSSRGSLGSMDDSRDYHRPLNVRNPDP
ncbi:hypothetical protein DM02DRAFT_649833 [Periconia macrospinosa]|uniref:WSC domain-containing protein n=1 Tax=Periconia macrospinosa TaxID=97972 RepID=A0A2V1E854_9PLEO|nr:hypothetical protein DM02DRAFT_649833 [Periconia macrospinosa]